jgi:hypothetical protein
MLPRSLTLSKPEELHLFFRAYRCHSPTGWWFRGQADASWELLPKAGRSPYKLKGGKSLGRFNSWSKKAVAYLPSLPDNDWERLAIAQHNGLATCLLDWTENPLVATYFACSELPNADGVVFCYDPDLFVDVKVLPLSEIESGVNGFMPRSISPRILNQRAVFTVHLPATRTLSVKASPLFEDHPNLARLIIPANQKPALLQMLNDYGINHAVLFADLEGLSRHVNWETTTIANPGGDGSSGAQQTGAAIQAP